jgi:small-conductance mechanosensitive channel
MKIMGDCLSEETTIIHDRSVVLLSEINETGLVFSVKILITDLAIGSKIKSHLLTVIYKAFAEHNILFSCTTFQPID